MCLEGAFTNYYKGISWAYGRLALGMERGKILTMTPDERLDRLTERHEALAESLQLLTADVQSLAQSTKELRESTKELRESVTEHGRVLRGHADLIGDLAKIAAGHEQRVQRLEGRQG